MSLMMPRLVQRPVLHAVCLASAMLAGMAYARAEHAVNGRLCVVPVLNGAPTNLDNDSAWDMAQKVLMLPGIAKPVIYPGLRPGVWTIDDRGRFVPFGGEFPRSWLWDSYARDPATGRILGSNQHLGVFAIKPGETRFSRVVAADGKKLTGFVVTAFIERFGKFILTRGKDLYTFDRDNVLAPFPFDDPSDGPKFHHVRDVPAIDALAVISEYVHWREALYPRFNDGGIKRMLDFDETIRDVTIPPSGNVLVVRTNRTTHRLALPRPPHAVTREQTRIEEPLLRWVKMPSKKYGRFVYRLAASSIGKTLLYSRRGLFELSAARGIVPVALPFDPKTETINAVAELPASHLVVIITTAGVYALDGAGAITRVPGGQRVGHSLGQSKGIIPVHNEMLLLGARALFLIADWTLFGDDACAAADRTVLPASDICMRRVGDFDDTTIGYFRILGESPNRRDLLLASQNGPVYAWRTGEPCACRSASAAHIRTAFIHCPGTGTRRCWPACTAV
jgi:hypothetical protein